MYPCWYFWLLFALAMAVSSIGFKNYVWFISLGYGFSIAAAGLLMLALFHDALTLGTVLCCVIFFLYGCRLGGYLAYRELKSSSYKKNMTGEIKDGKTVPLWVKLAIWITCALLYATQVSPVFYRLFNGAGSNVWVYIGAVVMVCGITLESAADIQKNRAKKINPRRFVDTGLYRIVRCPNYLGEMSFWAGAFLYYLPLYPEKWYCGLGFVSIIALFISVSVPMMEKHNAARRTGWEEYKAKTSALFILPNRKKGEK